MNGIRAKGGRNGMKEKPSMAQSQNENSIDVSGLPLDIVERVAELMPGGFFIYRAGGNEELIYANLATVRLFGCETLEELRKHTGNSFRGFVHPDDYEEISGSINEQIADEDNEEDMDYVEYRIVRKDGSVRWVDDYGHLARNEEFGDIYYVFINDATGRRMQAELDKIRRENEMKSEFLFNVSHDIRTPMNSILGYTALAKDNLKDTALLGEYLEKVETSGKHLLSLIDDLIEMSELESGSVELREEPLRLADELREAYGIIKTAAEEKGISLSLETALPDSELMIDSPHLRSIVLNLLDNAVKFTPSGGRVLLRAEELERGAEGSNCLISVRDSGIGMSPEFTSRIFDAFAREESSTVSGEKGTGLGLSVVKKLTDLMGGRIYAESEKGKGSSFFLELPLKNPAAAENPMGAEALPLRRDHSEKRILVVEDIELNRELALAVLEAADFKVEEAEDGRIALEKVKNSPAGYYDLVLMDIQMPNMNGYEAARAIRELPREDVKRLPILALSANARDEDRRMALESGMDGHMAKPFDAERLIAAIDEYTDRI